MSYLTTTEMELNLPALSYIADERVITVGELEFAVDANLPYTSPWVIVRHDAPNQLEEAGVCMNIHAKLIGTPDFHEWLGRVVAKPELKEKVRLDTAKAMCLAFQALEPDMKVAKSKHFNMTVREHDHANLSTFGLCACLHPNPEGQWVRSDDWDEGYCEYDWHNIEINSQMWSLLAGMGHLARLSAEDFAG